jgi:protocatechuate 3,4-dioxygenase beta subunit
MNGHFPITRQQAVVSGLALAAAQFPGIAAAARLLATPTQTPGPFYPSELPLDSDTDLVRVRGRAASAEGRILHVFGRLLDVDGRPLGGARVEIWQCDARGVYHHPGDRHAAPDLGFQGYGQMGVGADGKYRFRTIRPVPYPGRTPHIHVAVSALGRECFTTQMYEKGHPLNDGDFVLNRIPAGGRERLMVTFEPAPEIETDALKGRFDIVLGS